MYTVQEEMIFQIPWKHAAKHGWDINKDACLFRSWAIHTGGQGGGGGRGETGGDIHYHQCSGWPLSSLTQHAELLEQGGEMHLCFSRTESLF